MKRQYLSPDRLLLDSPKLAGIPCLFLSLLVLSGCNTAYREAIVRARKAAIGGDFMTATRAYRDACTAEPDDKTACTRVPIFAQKATDQAIAAARPACEAGDLDRCLPPLLATRDIMPDHPEVTAMFEKASQLQTERCVGKWKLEGPLNSAVAGLACLESRRDQLPVPSYQSLITGSASRLSSRFTELALTAQQSRETSGAATVLWSTARCLAPDEDKHSRFSQSRMEFLNRSSIPITIDLGGSVPSQIAEGLSDLCKRLSWALPPWARCAETGTEPDQPEVMDVHVDALIQRPQEAISEEPRSITYVSGKRMEPNANYGLVRAHFDEAEYALKRVERQKSAKDAECTSFKSVPQSSQSSQEDPCDEAKLLAERYGERNTELEKATKQLRETPKEVAIEVYSTFNYVVRNHIWSSGYHFTVQTNTPGAPTPLRQQGTLRFEDKEHVGLAVAKLREDPLVVPLPDAYSKAFLAQLGSAVTSMVRADGEVRGSARRAQCQELPADWSIPWVQCWAEASLWGSAREGDGVGFLQVLATSAEGTSSPRCR